MIDAAVCRIGLMKLWRVETLRFGQLTERDQKFGRVLGIIVVAIILVTAARLGALTYRQNLATAVFYQTSFGPALNFACNGTYNQIKQTGPAERFLQRKSNSLDSCSAVEDVPVKSISGFENSMVYLELASAAAWKVLGFDWGSLFVLAAALTSGLALASYSLLRVFFVSRLASAILTFIFMSSPWVVAQIPHLRDFSKAPFLIGALACIGAAVLRPHRAFVMLLLAAGAGALASIGLGFRPDLTVVLPIALLSPLLLIGSDTLRATARRITLIWIGFGAGYIAFRLPANLIGGVEGAVPATFIPHVFILGFADQFLQALGMSDASYSVFRPYYDEFVYGAVNLFGGNGLHGSPIEWGSAEYDQVSRDFLKSILLLVPYDALLRIFYTANAIGHLPINALIWGLPLLLLTPFLLIVRLRCFLFAFLALGILSATLSLQYDSRHVFYMSLLGPIIIALSASALLDTARRVCASEFHLPAHLGLKAGSILLSVVLLAAVSQLLASIQREGLQNLATTFADLEWKSIRFRTTRDRLEPEFTKTENNLVPAVTLQQSSKGETEMRRRIGTFSRVTLKLEPTEPTALPVELSWTALPESVQLKDKQFTISTNNAGYAIESNSIFSRELSLPLSGKKVRGQKLWLRVTGETLRGAFSVGILDHEKNKFAFMDRLPYGSWQFVKPFEITPDLNEFTIVFGNYAGAHSTIRVDSAELVTFPETGCSTPGARVTAEYAHAGQQINLGGVTLSEQAGLAVYYFPQVFAFDLQFIGLKLDGLSPDCVLDWSIAKDFPAGTVPAELLTTDGRLGRFQHGDWMSIWRNFIN
jgi:hypothetical protein